jgi:hypothetical protein
LGLISAAQTPRRDRTGDHALAFAIALHGRAELLNHAHRFVADGQAARHRVLAFQDVHIGAADRRRCDFDQRIERADVGHRFVVEHDASGFNKYGSFHLDDLLAGWRWLGSAQPTPRLRRTGSELRRIAARQARR